MTIEFEPPKPLVQARSVLQTVAQEMMRPKSREFDEDEHAISWDYIEFMNSAMRSLGGGSLAPRDDRPEAGQPSERKAESPPIAYQMLATQIEALAWGAACARSPPIPMRCACEVPLARSRLAAATASRRTIFLMTLPFGPLPTQRARGARPTHCMAIRGVGGV